MRTTISLLVFALLLLSSGCSLVTDFGKYKFGNNDGGAGTGGSGKEEDAGGGTGGKGGTGGSGGQEAGLPQDSGKDAQKPDAEVDSAIPENCGNRAVDPGEQCDDGNQVSGDGCEPNCTYTCEEASDCDDDQVCDGQEICTVAHTCVSGNIPGDIDCPLEKGGTGTCKSGLCVSPDCGNGVIDDGESCDDKGESKTCNVDCTTAKCGDHKQNVTAGEQCDEGAPSAKCDKDCRCTSSYVFSENQCQCEANLFDTGSSCIDEVEVPCDVDNDNPGNSHDVVANVSITYTDAGGWTAPAKCAWDCNTNYDLIGEACLHERTVQCDTDNGNPANSTDIIANVTITYTDAGGWSSPAACAWKCNANYGRVGDACLNERKVPCDGDNNNPENSHDVVANVSITYTDAAGWTAPAKCAWDCNTDYDLIGEACLHEQTVQCDTNNGNPANSTDIIANVTITYTDAGGWSAPAPCAFDCDADYGLVGDACLHEQTVQCDTNNGNPANSTDIIANVTITYTDAGGWSSPAKCAWDCNEYYTVNKAGNACFAIDCVAQYKVGNTANGAYTVFDPDTGDGKVVYCLQTAGHVAIEFAVGNYSASYTGWTVMDIATWENVNVHRAFIGYYKGNNGLPNLDIGWTDSNCCMYLPGNKALWLGPQNNWTNLCTTSGTTVCNTIHNNPKYYIGKFGTCFAPATMQDTFFQQYPPWAKTDCGPGNNAGIFIRTTGAVPVIQSFYDGFEANNLNKWVVDGTGFATSTVVQSGNGTYSAIQTGSDGVHGTGMHVAWPSGITPNYIRVWMRTSDTATIGPYFTSNYNATDGSINDYPFFIYMSGGILYNSSASGGNNITTAISANTWYRIELRNINWATYSYDYYVNGVSTGTANFRTKNSNMKRINAYNYVGSTSSYWDEIIIQ